MTVRSQTHNKTSTEAEICIKQTYKSNKAIENIYKRSKQRYKPNITAKHDDQAII